MLTPRKMLWLLDEWDRAQGSSSVLVSDSFNRVDNAVSLGLADTGQAWSALSGTWGISSNLAACTVHASNDIAIVDVGVSDCTVAVTTSVIGNDGGLTVRATDVNNYIRLIFDAGTTWYLQKCVAGAFTILTSVVGTNLAGDVISIVLSGNTITAFKNGVQILTATDPFNATATKHGLHANTTVSRFDLFSVIR